MFALAVLAATPAAAAAAAATQPQGLDARIAVLNADYVRDHPSDWGRAADREIARRLVTTQRAWERYRDLRCAGEGAACRTREAQLRVTELSRDPDGALANAIRAIDAGCDAGSSLDQSDCVARVYDHQVRPQIEAFVARYDAQHGGRRMAAVYKAWNAYQTRVCLRDVWLLAPVSAPSEGLGINRCVLMLAMADFAFAGVKP